MQDQQANDQDMLGRSVRDFVAAAAAKSPTPGGGSVAGVVGALGVALGEMALNFTKGKKKFAEHEEFYAKLSPRLARARHMFQDLVGEDMAAYALYQQTTRQEDGPEKARAMKTATAAAINVPREMTKLALAVLDDLLALSGKCNPYLISDLVAAAVLSLAAVKLSDLNVRINVPQVDDKDQGEQIRASSHNDVNKATTLLEAIEKAGAKHL